MERLHGSGMSLEQWITQEAASNMSCHGVRDRKETSGQTAAFLKGIGGFLEMREFLIIEPLPFLK